MTQATVEAINEAKASLMRLFDDHLPDWDDEEGRLAFIAAAYSETHECCCGDPDVRRSRDDGDVLFVLGRTSFVWSDFGMTAPNIGGFVRVTDEVSVEVLLALAPTAP